MLTEQGHPEDGTDDEAPNQAETFVIMKPRERVAHRAHARSRSSTRCARELEKRPGVDYNFSQPIKDRVEESISGIRGQVVVKIYGEDLHAHARASSRRSKRILDATRGARDVEIYRAGSAQHIVADIDRDAIVALGHPGARRRGRARERLRRQAGDRRCGRASARSACASSCRRRRRATPSRSARLEIPVGARARAARRRSPTCTSIAGRTQINREQGGRFLALKCNIEGRDMGSLRRRGAGARAARGEAARGLLHDLGRRVREPAARDEAARGHRADLGRW